RRRSWRNSKRIWLGGRRPSGWSGRKVVHGSSSSSAHRPCREKKQSPHVIFARLDVVRVATAVDNFGGPLLHDSVTGRAASNRSPGATARGRAEAGPQNAGSSCPFLQIPTNGPISALLAKRPSRTLRRFLIAPPGQITALADARHRGLGLRRRRAGPAAAPRRPRR